MTQRSYAMLLVAFTLVATTPAWGRVLAQEQSHYQNVIVMQQGTLRCLQFSVRRDQRRQSCLDTAAPRRLVFPYTRAMLAGLLLNESPQRILAVGLGGGSLPIALAELYPDAHIDAVELDPVVVRMAERYFGFERSERMRVFERDARVFGRRAAMRGERYDLILLDAFNAEYVPEHLMTQEYLEETRQLMAPGAVLVANTFATSRLYDYESATYAAVFVTFFNLIVDDTGNRVIIASNGPLPTRDALLEIAARLTPRLRRYGVHIRDYVPRMSTEADWDPLVQPLTDQYSPANLLRSRR
jgi:spermidine synthase